MESTTRRCKDIAIQTGRDFNDVFSEIMKSWNGQIFNEKPPSLNNRLKLMLDYIVKELSEQYNNKIINDIYIGDSIFIRNDSFSYIAEQEKRRIFGIIPTEKTKFILKLNRRAK